jgi:hypothetical protein
MRVFITPMRRLLPLSCLLTLVIAVPADARTVDRSRHLWATVNICDTKRYPDTIGIRASMPGSGRTGERMFMRFRVQYLSAEDNRWRDFASARGTDSGWVSVGSARFKARQSGWTFPFEMEQGGRHELRGVVRFEWRRGRRVVRRAVRRTRAGHRAAFADPRRYSAAACVIRG